MVDQAGMGRIKPRQPARLPDRMDEGTSGHDQVPGRDDVDAALGHSVPGDCGSARDHEHHHS